MMKLYLFCLSLLASLCQAQQPADTIRFYYSIGSTEPLSGLQKLDSAISAHRRDTVNISLYGYADFLGSTASNQSLSQARAERLGQLIRDKAYPNLGRVTKFEGRGERPFLQQHSPLGDPFSRRVDVLLTYVPVLTIKKDPAPVQVPPEKVMQENLKAQEEPKDITSLKVGEAMALKGINFIGGRHIMVPESKAPLLALLKTLKENPSMKIEIQGHVCCTSSEEDGLDLDTGQPRLSVNRAHAVYNFLVENGIDQSRLRYKGFGHSKPLVWPEDTEVNMQANRRVEIMIIGK